MAGFTAFPNRCRESNLPDKPPRPRKDAEAIAKTCFMNKGADYKRIDLASALGVSSEVLADLCVGVGWDYDGTEWASFPSRGINGEIVGITRRYDNGSKKTLAGTSNAGIFCKGVVVDRKRHGVHRGRRK